MPIWRRPDTGGFRALLLSVLLVACGEDSQDRVTGAENGPGLVPLAVAGVISQADGTAAVLLHTPNGQNVVVPVTGCAAQTIDAKLRGESFPRPLTHDLFTVIADSLALSVDRVVLDGTVDGSVTASIVLRGPQVSPALSATAGDALAVAQRAAADIRGTPDLLDHRALADGADKTLTRREPPGALAVREGPAGRAGKHAARSFRGIESPVVLRVLEVLDSAFSGMSVLLIDADEHFVLSMGIDLCQAYAIASMLHSWAPSFAETHALLYSLLEAGGAQMTHAGIVSLEEYYFVGEISLLSGGRQIPVDARPSDAIALSLFADAPIRMGLGLLEAVGEDAELFRELIDASHTGE